MQRLSICLISIMCVTTRCGMSDDTKNEISLSQAQYLWLNSRLRDAIGGLSPDEIKKKKDLFAKRILLEPVYFNRSKEFHTDMDGICNSPVILKQENQVQR